MNMRTASFPVVFAALFLFLASRSAAISQVVQFGPDVLTATQHVLTPPLRDMKRVSPVVGTPRVIQHATHPAATNQILSFRQLRGKRCAWFQEV